MTSDSELLRRYAEKADETAFAEVARRHLNLVYASALRLLNGDKALAEDVTQTVLTDLASKAATLVWHGTVAGWLHNSVRFAASNAVRAEKCRRTHEQEASTMSDQTTGTDISWTQLRPLLDNAVGHLGEEERNAVLLRFFEEKSHREVGEALGLTENTARMRVERAVEKLRGYFLRHGVTTTAALLAATLDTQAASIPPSSAFAATVIGKSLAGAAAQGSPGATAATGPATSFLAKIMVGVMAAAVFLFFLTFQPGSSAGKPVVLAAMPASPTAAALTNPAQSAPTAGAPKIPGGAPAPTTSAIPAAPALAAPSTPFTMSPTQNTGASALRLYAGSSEDIAAAKRVMADISRLFHAGDMAAFADKYILPEERDQVKEMMEKMKAEPSDQQYRWQLLLSVFDVLQDQTPGFTISGVATFDDHLLLANTPEEKYVPDNWVSLKKQNGQWYLTPGEAGGLHNAAHLK